MKKYLLCLCLILCIPLLGQAQTVRSCSVSQPCEIVWDRNTESDMASYRLYLSQQSGIYTTPIQTLTHPVTQTSLGILPQGIYFLVVTAVDVAGNESLRSNELTFFFDGNPGSPTIRFSVLIP